MKRVILAWLFVVLFGVSSFAQTTVQSVDGVVSDVAVGANVVLDAVQILSAPDKGCAAKQEALKVVLAVGITEGVKFAVRHQRGASLDQTAYPSTPTALAFASTGWNVGFGYSFAIGAGSTRVVAKQADTIGSLFGAAAGIGARYLAPAIIPCGK